MAPARVNLFQPGNASTHGGGSRHMSFLQLGRLLNSCSHLGTILALPWIEFLGSPRGDAVWLYGAKCERCPPKLAP